MVPEWDTSSVEEKVSALLYYMETLMGRNKIKIVLIAPFWVIDQGCFSWDIIICNIFFKFCNGNV